ncbi:MAG: response regulator transcription factor [Flavobacteriales bacterium]|nr:response regulator transcription factor [Flavobacteriales bacterium]
METQRYTMVLVDDQSIFLDGIESLLERMPEVRIIGKAHNGRAALDLVTVHEAWCSWTSTCREWMA